MKGGLRFSFKMLDIASFGRRLIRSARDVKVTVSKFFKPRKPVDISLKNKETAEIQKIKEAQAIKVSEGKISKVNAQKETVDTLLRTPSFLERIKGFFRRGFNAFLRKPDVETMRAETNAEIKNIKDNAEQKAKEEATKKQQEFIDANKPAIEANKNELSTTVNSWRNGFLTRLGIIRSRIDPDLELRDRTSRANDNVKKANAEMKNTELEASNTRRLAAEAEIKAREAELNLRTIRQGTTTKEQLEIARLDAKKARTDANTAKSRANEADLEARKARTSSDRAKVTANRTEIDVNNIRQRYETGTIKEAEVNASKLRSDAETAKKRAEEADNNAKKAREDAAKADAAANKADQDLKDIENRNGTIDEIDTAKINAKKLREDAEVAKKRAEEADANANKLKDEANDAVVKADEAEANVNTIREKFSKDTIDRADSTAIEAKNKADEAEQKANDADANAVKAKDDAEKAEISVKTAEANVNLIYAKLRAKNVLEEIEIGKKIRNEADTAKQNAKEAEAKANKTKEEAKKAEAAAIKAEQELKDIRNRNGTKEEIDRAENNAKTARNKAEEAKKKAEEADNNAKKAREDANKANEAVLKADEDLDRIRNSDHTSAELDQSKIELERLRKEAELANKKAIEAELEAKKFRGEAEKVGKQARDAEENVYLIRERIVRNDIERANNNVNDAKSKSDIAKKRAEEADVNAKKAREDAAKADAAVNKAETELNDIRLRNGTKVEIDIAEANLKDLKSKAETAKKRAEEADANARKARDDADKALARVNDAEANVSLIRETFRKSSIERAEGNAKKARDDAETAKKRADEADANAKKAREEADKADAAARRAEQDLDAIRRRNGTKEEIEKADANAKKAREDAETAKKRAEEADANAKKARAEANRAELKVNRAETDVNNIRDRDIDLRRLDSDTPNRLRDRFNGVRQKFIEAWRRTELFRQNVKLFIRKISGFIFMILLIILPIILSIVVRPPPPPPPPEDPFNPFNNFIQSPGPGVVISGTPPGGPPGGPPFTTPPPISVRPPPAPKNSFNFQGIITFTLANEPDEDITFQLKPTSNNLEFDDDTITFKLATWNSPIQTNYYCNLDNSILDDDRFNNLNTNARTQYLQKETYVEPEVLEGPSTQQIIAQRNRIDYLLQPNETLGETLERLENERKYEKQFEGGDGPEPVYDDNDYNIYEPIVDPMIRQSEINGLKEFEYSDKSLEEVVEPLFDDGYELYNSRVIPTYEDEQIRDGQIRGGQIQGGQNEELYGEDLYEEDLYGKDDIENLEYGDIAAQAEIDDLADEFKCKFGMILAQVTNYPIGVNIELDDFSLVLDPTYLEMDGTNPIGYSSITTSQIINMYQQYTVLNTTNQLENQANTIADQKYNEGMGLINEQEEFINSNADLIYQNAYENSLYEDEMLIEDGKFINNALDFDEMYGGSYFLKKFKKTKKIVN